MDSTETKYHLNNLEITLDKRGADRYTKTTYPVRYGRYCEIKTQQHLFQFNLNGQIKTIRGLDRNWPHPAEWLKRTDTDDWVFYTVGRYHRLYSFLGEYYLPCLPYPSNSPWEYDPFNDAAVRNAMAAWTRLPCDLRPLLDNGIPAGVKEFVAKVAHQDAITLRRQGERLHQIIGGRLTVLPPDTRHADYDVIPLVVADGCLYHCGFCCVKSHQNFQRRSLADIRRQIKDLKNFYSANLSNYNALFLGDHDALAGGRELIETAAVEAYRTFNFESANLKNPALYFFGSVDSLLNAGEDLFANLDRLPFHTTINIGLESVDAATLALINKPLPVARVKNAFQKLLDINRRFINIEITANFLLGDSLPTSHYESFQRLIDNNLNRFYSKGAVYLSPLNTSKDRTALLQRFVELKNLSRLPTFLYLIQRL